MTDVRRFVVDLIDLAVSATPEEQEFIEAIKLRPEDNAPRLIFADFLEEHGHDEPAERLRVQTRRRFHDKDHRNRRGQRHWSVLELYLDHGRGACTEWVDWKAGFTETVVCRPEWWLHWHEVMTKYHPIRKVTVPWHPPAYCNLGSGMVGFERPNDDLAMELKKEDWAILFRSDRHEPHLCFTVWRHFWPQIELVVDPDCFGG